jgi:hypothetical protein
MPRSQRASARSVPAGLTRRGAVRLLGGAAAATLLADTGLAALRPGVAAATTVVAQSGTVPFPITQGATTDVTTVLLATSASYTSDLEVYSPGSPKNFYMYNFLETTDFLSWEVSVETEAAFQITALVDAQPEQQLTLTISGGSPASLAATTLDTVTWQRLVMGQVTLPAGTTTLTLTRTGTLSDDLYVKALELIEVSQLSDYQSAVSAARADTTAFSEAKYGLMFQYGSWGFPNNVGPAKPLDVQAADFNVDAFMTLVQEAGASYVIWSFSWWGYHIDAPITEIDTIVTDEGGPASPGLTAATDVIGAIATACQNAGIMFFMYYHTGDEDADWWPYQDFPATFSENGTGDRSTFFDNWTSVITAIGNQYGTNLDGFFFDDGCIYYPASFQAMEQTARTGNPNRLVSWNMSPFGNLNATDFQDVLFGEGSEGQAMLGSAPAGGNGVLSGGPATGLLQHGMFTMDSDWGVHLQDQQISPDTSLNPTSANVIGWIQSAITCNVPVSIDLMMYEDGTVADADRRVLIDLCQAVYGTPPSVPTSTTMVNDTDSGITYTGSWTYSADRNAGDYDNDVHYTSTVGDSFSYTFTGTGIDVIGPKSDVSDLFSVTIDGTEIGQFSQYASSGYEAQSLLYGARYLTPGSHTITCAMVSGTYFQLDALRVVPDPTMVNDTDPSITYDSTWTYSDDRNAGDYDNDVHYTSTIGGTATITFTGTGIDYIGPMEPEDGTANVIIDGVQVGTTQATYSGSYTPQQYLYQVRGLTADTHTLQIVMTGGTYVQIDAFQIWP